jgi:hypothetical protein
VLAASTQAQLSKKFLPRFFQKAASFLPLPAGAKNKKGGASLRRLRLHAAF